MKSVTYTIARPDTGAVLPYAPVTVFQADGATRAALFDDTGGVIGNPVSADGNGAVNFAATNGIYVLRASSADGLLSVPDIEVEIFDLDALATAIAAGSLAGVIGAKFATDTAMRADLAHAAGTIALVYADSSPLKNDLYYKIGGSGSGSWSTSLGLMAGLSYAYAQQADTFRKRAGNAVPFFLRSALLSATGMVSGDTTSVTADSGTHTAVSGEAALGGGAATVGAAIPNTGGYTYNGSAWLRTGDTVAQTATLAVAATREPFGVEIYNAGVAIIEGVYNGDYNAAANYTVNRFTAVIEDATAGSTADITAQVNGVAVYGPVTVTFGTTLATTPSFAIPSGAADSYLVERLTGTVRKLYIRADGVPT